LDQGKYYREYQYIFGGREWFATIGTLITIDKATEDWEELEYARLNIHLSKLKQK